MKPSPRPLLAAALTLLGSCASPVGPPPPIDWQEWSPQTFERARAEERLVLLHLGAVWCHWCHVMEHETYEDPEVLRLIDEGWVAIYVDQDARPDVSNRYEDYGWPATIMFDSEMNELAKLRGYIPPRNFESRLRAFMANPVPGPSVRRAAEPVFDEEAGLGVELRADVEARRIAGYDESEGGWGTVHKFLERGNVEYALTRAARGDLEEERRARTVLELAQQLIDPVWGGAYQYSHGGVWTNPHYEKIMSFQAGYLSAYSLAYAQWGERVHREGADAIYRYLIDFLRDEAGGFYVSQDADIVPGVKAHGFFALDDAGRRAQGMPRIDENLYARESGWAIDALCVYAMATGNAQARTHAEEAARWVLAERALGDGGFAHGADDLAGPFLDDTLAMGRGFLGLYQLTGALEWLEHASAAADFVAATFAAPEQPGYLTAEPAPGASGPFLPVHQFEENIELARWANLLAEHTGAARHDELALDAMRYLSAPSVTRRRRTSLGGLLLADQELASEPLHVTVVAPAADESGAGLFRAAQALPGWYKRVERWDPAGPALPNPDIPLPAVQSPAAFVCANGACSSPIEDPLDLAEAAARR